jgi:hypothetical protein
VASDTHTARLATRWFFHMDVNSYDFVVHWYELP